MTADKDDTKGKLDFEPATISNGQTKSNVIDLRGMTLCGLYMPAAFTGVAISFEAATAAAGSYIPVEDGLGAAVSLVVSPGKYVRVDPALYAGIQFLKIVSGATELGDRQVDLGLRQI